MKDQDGGDEVEEEEEARRAEEGETAEWRMMGFSTPEV